VTRPDLGALKQPSHHFGIPFLVSSSHCSQEERLEAAEAATWNAEIELATSKENAEREKDELLHAMRDVEGQLSSFKQATALLGAEKAAMATKSEELVRRRCCWDTQLVSL